MAHLTIITTLFSCLEYQSLDEIIGCSWEALRGNLIVSQKVIGNKACQGGFSGIVLFTLLARYSYEILHLVS